MILLLLLKILLLEFYFSKTLARTVTIMHAANFGGHFKEIRLANGTTVGGAARIAYLLKDCGSRCVFVYHGNLLSNTSWNDTESESIDHAIQVLKLLKPKIVILGQNEYNTSKEIVERFENEFEVPESNIMVLGSPRNHVIVNGVNFRAYVEGVDEMPGVPPGSFELSIPSHITENYYKVRFLLVAGCVSRKVANKFPPKKEYVNVILSSCSSELFWNTITDAPENMPVTSIYPEVFPGNDGDILLAHVYGGTRFMGKLTLRFSRHKLLTHKSEMLYMYHEVPQDKEVLAVVGGAEEPSTTPTTTLSTISETTTTTTTETPHIGPIGHSAVFLNGQCDKNECNLGNLIADAFIQYIYDIYTGEYWTDTPIAIIAAGSIKSDIDASTTRGQVSANDVKKVLPDDDRLVTMEITGSDIRRALEFALEDANKHSGSKAFLQVAGMRLVFDNRKTRGQKLMAVRVRCHKCETPAYANLKRAAKYRIITTKKLANGAFGHDILKYQGKIVKEESMTAQKAVCNYIKYLKTIYTMNSERIVNHEAEDSAGYAWKPSQIILWGLTAWILFK